MSSYLKKLLKFLKQAKISANETSCLAFELKLFFLPHWQIRLIFGNFFGKEDIIS